MTATPESESRRKRIAMQKGESMYPKNIETCPECGNQRGLKFKGNCNDHWPLASEYKSNLEGNCPKHGDDKVIIVNGFRRCIASGCGWDEMPTSPSVEMGPEPVNTLLTQAKPIRKCEYCDRGWATRFPGGRVKCDKCNGIGAVPAEPKEALLTRRGLDKEKTLKWLKENKWRAYYGAVVEAIESGALDQD